jgi:hypothetical protein
MGKFSYQSGDTTFKGDFNIYQARHGGIMLLMGNTAVCLTQQQVNDLAITVYELAEFDLDSYKSFYENEKQALNISAVNYLLSHYFDASPDNDRFCKCGKYLTDDCHKRQL